MPDALSAIRWLRARGVRVQLGHSKATTDQTLSALEAGAQGLTHLYNAMRTHHRDPGLLTGVLSGRAQSEIITDGFHVHPLTVYAATQQFPGQLYGVSDCCAAAGTKLGAGSGRQTLGSISVVKKGPVAMVADPSGKPTTTLAGAATLLSEHPERLYKALVLIVPARDLQETILSLFRNRSHEIAAECLRVPLQDLLKASFSIRLQVKTLRFLGAWS